MSLAVHTFEINPSGDPTGFAFHEEVNEGRGLYFLSKFGTGTPDARNIAETIFGTVLDSLRNTKAVDPYDQFEDALKVANAEARKHTKSFTKTPDIIIAFFDFHHLYLSQSGESEAYLVRGASVSQISESSETQDDLFQNILSGQVAVDDTVILTSTRLLRSITASEMADVFGRADFGESVGNLRTKLTTTTEEDLVVTAIGVAKKEETPSAGFLSKVVTKGKEAVAKAKSKSTHSTPIAPMTEEKPKLIEENEDAKTEHQDPQGPERPEAPQAPQDPSKVRRKVNVLAKIQNSFRSFTALKQQKNALTIAGTVLGILVVVIGVRFLTNFESSQTAELREQVSVAQEALQQAETLLIQGERQGASDYLTQAQESVQKVLNSRSTKFRSDAQFLLADIQSKQLQVENAKKVQPVLLADLSVKNDNLEAIGLIKLGEKLFGYDLQKVYKTVRNVVEKGLLVSSQETILAGEARNDQNALVFLTDSPRVFEYREGSINAMNTDDETWKTGIDVETYGQYIYLLDPAENQIWKYQRRRSNYSGAVAYNQGADLSLAVSMTIDGAIYVISEDGNIQKVFRGVVADYDFRDLPSTEFMGKNLKIYTGIDLDFLYVLDPDNARVLVFKKGDRFATYTKQLIYDVPGAKDFVIDDSEQKVNIITQDKIYEFGL